MSPAVSDWDCVPPGAVKAGALPCLGTRDACQIQVHRPAWRMWWHAVCTTCRSARMQVPGAAGPCWPGCLPNLKTAARSSTRSGGKSCAEPAACATIIRPVTGSRGCQHESRVWSCKMWTRCRILPQWRCCYRCSSRPNLPDDVSRRCCDSLCTPPHGQPNRERPIPYATNVL